MVNVFCTPRMILSGEGALQGSGEVLKGLGRKALVVSDSTMLKLGNVGVVEEVLKAEGVAYDVFAEVETEPTDSIVDKGVAAYKAGGCDFLIAIGGGSPIDTMKAIAMLITLGGTAADYFGKAIRGPLLPMVAIPTTAGTGSEATRATIISDAKTQVKMLLSGPGLIPDVAIVDPRFTLTAPARLTAFTGVDALCHCVEAYISVKAQPLSDTFALSAAKRIFENLPLAFTKPENMEARAQMAIAATEAGIAFSNSSVTVIHGMSRPIGALFHVPHGLSNAILAEKCLLFAREGAEKRFADIARYCGMCDGSTPDGPAADAFFGQFLSLIRLLEIPGPAECGIDREAFEQQIPRMARDAEKSGSPGNTPRTVTTADMEAIYRDLWS